MILGLGVCGEAAIFGIRGKVRVTLGLGLDVYHNIFSVFKIRLPVLNFKLTYSLAFFRHYKLKRLFR